MEQNQNDNVMGELPAEMTPEKLAALQELTPMFEAATMSGDPSAIKAMQDAMQQKGVFSGEDIASIPDTVAMLQELKQSPELVEQMIEKMQSAPQEVSPAAQQFEDAYNASLGMDDPNRVQRLDGIYANSPEDSMASQKAQLEQQQRELYRAKEELLTQNETKTGTSPITAAAVGGSGAAIAMAAAHQLYNATPKLSRLIEKVGDLAANNKDIAADNEKVIGAVKGFVENAGINDGKIGEFAEKVLKHVKDKQSLSAESISEGLGAILGKDDTVKESLGKLASVVQKGVQKGKNASDITKNITDNDELKKVVGDNLDQVKDLIGTQVETASKVGDLRGLNSVKEAIFQSIKSNAVGKKLGSAGEWFNKLGTEHSNKIIDWAIVPTNGKIAQTALVTGIVAATALTVIGVDSLIKGGEENQKAETKVQVAELQGKILDNQRAIDGMAVQ